MKTHNYTLTKDKETSTKYVVTSTAAQRPDFMLTSSTGEIPMYIYGDKYGKPQIKGKLKLVGKKGHVSTLFPVGHNIDNLLLYSGDIRSKNDLILLAASEDFEICNLILLEDAKSKRRQIIDHVRLNGLKTLL